MQVALADESYLICKIHVLDLGRYVRERSESDLNILKAKVIDRRNLIFFLIHESCWGSSDFVIDEICLHSDRISSTSETVNPRFRSSNDYTTLFALKRKPEMTSWPVVLRVFTPD